MLNLIKYKIKTNDGLTFEIQFNELEISLSLEKEDLLFTIEKKCNDAILEGLNKINLVITPDAFMIIELASDLWSKRNRFFTEKKIAKGVVVLDSYA